MDLKQLFLLLVVALFTVPSNVDGAGRSCTRLFSCMGGLFQIPFKEIAVVSARFSQSLLRLSEVSDEDWETQNQLLVTLCNTWTTFDTCMDDDWIDCVDFDQMVTLINMVGSVGDTQLKTNTSQQRNDAVGGTANAFDGIGWEWNSDKTREAVEISSYMCKHMPQIVPFLSCFRDTMLMNETIVNATTQYAAVIQAGCNGGLQSKFQTLTLFHFFLNCLSMHLATDCKKTEVLNKVLGHWLYHGCKGAIEHMLDIVKVIFMTMSLGSPTKGICPDIFHNKTAEQIFAAPYPPRWAEHFGEPNYDSECNKQLVARKYNEIYQKSIVKYMAQRNISTPCEFYQQNYCRKDPLQCELTPLACYREIMSKRTTAPPPSTTTTITETDEAAGGSATVGRPLNPRIRYVRRRVTTTMAARFMARRRFESNNNYNAAVSSLQFTTNFHSTCTALLIAMVWKLF